MDDVKSVLILEDDITWQPDCWDGMKKFIKAVPDDWDQLCLGGQHMHTPCDIGIPGCVQAKNCQRTHAYAVRGQHKNKLLHLWRECAVHIDWEMGGKMSEWTCYAPDPFLFGQAGGKSDISGRTNPSYIWSSGQKKTESDTILILRSPRDVVDNLTGFHRGYWLHDNGIDNGLLGCCTRQDKVRALQDWLVMITHESKQIGSVPLVWCDLVSVEEIRAAAPDRKAVVEIRATDISDFRRQWAETKQACLNAPHTPRRS
jgi:hypothetical protein